jgi:hypothetical protein
MVKPTTMISDCAGTEAPKAARARATSSFVPRLFFGMVFRKPRFVGRPGTEKHETEFREIGSQRGVWEPSVFGLLVVLYLLPVWIYAYAPTQDGPAHLANALILKNLAAGQTRYHEFFAIRWEPLPNWTTHLVLAGLLCVFPPLLAHKALVSLYVLGFAWSFRYFLASFGRNTLLLAPAGLLFVYNRCFLTGFYNYCLSLIAFWIILGYVIRRRDRFGLSSAAVLMAFFWLAYFTHLLGYVLAAAGAVFIMVWSSPRRLRKLGLLAIALLPTAFLAADSLLEPGLLGLREGLAHRPPWLHWHTNLEAWWQSLLSVNEQLFEPYEAWEIPLGVLVLFFYEAGVVATLLAPQPPAKGEASAPGSTLAAGSGDPAKTGMARSLGALTQPRSPLGALTQPRSPIVLFGAGIGVLYLVLPDFLSAAIGFLKARLVLLPPLLWLTCLRLPDHRTLRRAFTAFLYSLLAINLVLVIRYFYVANQELAEYTAGIQWIGHDRTLFVEQSRAGPRKPSYLEHAANYYCLANGNINLDNYQAELNHFPVRYRSGIARGRGDISDYPNRDLVDLILVWDTEPDFSPEIARSFRPVFRAGRLQLFERIPGNRERKTAPEA